VITLQCPGYERGADKLVASACARLTSRSPSLPGIIDLGLEPLQSIVKGDKGKSIQASDELWNVHVLEGRQMPGRKTKEVNPSVPREADPVPESIHHGNA
jgi:hypothetical protein